MSFGRGNSRKVCSFIVYHCYHDPSMADLFTPGLLLFYPEKAVKNNTPGNILLNVLLPQSSVNNDIFPSFNSTSWIIYDNYFLTRILFIPCLTTMLLSSLLLVYLVRKYLRDSTIIYFSVLIYTCCQILMLVVILQDLILASWSLSSILFCKIRSTSEIFVLVISAYSILTMTGVRFIFVQKPLRYRSILKLRYQWSVVVMKVLVTSALTLSPIFGLCELGVEEEMYCHFKVSNGRCVLFQVLCVGVGIILPVITTVFLYGGILIYRTILRLRTNQKWLKPSPPTTSLSKERCSQNSAVCSNKSSSSAHNGCTQQRMGSQQEKEEKLDAREDKKEKEKLDTANKETITPSPNVTKSENLIVPLTTSNHHGPAGSTVKQSLFPTSNTMRRISRKKVTSLKKVESRQVPWSIMAVLILYVITTLPWIALIVAPQIWFQVPGISGQLRLVLDLKYAIMFVGIACSPIATIVTNKALRKSFWRLIYSLQRKK